MSHIRDKKMWWVVNFCRPTVTLPPIGFDLLSAIGLLFSAIVDKLRWLGIAAPAVWANPTAVAAILIAIVFGPHSEYPAMIGFLQFGIGDIAGVRVSGAQASPDGPEFFGSIQDAGVDITAQLVELRGQSQYVDDIAHGNKDVKGKIGLAKFEIGMFNKLFLADTISTGIKVFQSQEAHSVPTTPGPYTITITHSGSAITDLGVMDAATGKPYNRVNGGSEQAGISYSVNTTTGVYTFAAGDQAVAVLISYGYTDTSTGNTLAIDDHPMGYGPAIELWLRQPYEGHNGLHLFKVKVGKMGAPQKRDNYMITDFEFTAMKNSGNHIGEWFQATP